MVVEKKKKLTHSNWSPANISTGFISIAKKMKLSIFFLIVVLAVNFAGLSTSSSSSTFMTGRSLLQGNISDKSNDDTVRTDPLNNFKKYRDGYDITDKHYWSSAIYTGAYGYAIGLLWLIIGVIYGGYLVATIYCCMGRKSKRKMKKGSACRKNCYMWPVITASVFTILAIVASCVVLGANARFYTKAKTVVHIIINTATDASETIYNTTGAMTDMRNHLDAYNGGGNISTFLNNTSEKLDVYAEDIDIQARKNRHLIDIGLKIMFIITTTIISLNLIAVIALLVSGVLKFQRATHTVIILCWMLTVLCWLFFGLFFFVEKFSTDTCTALEDFQHNPFNNSLMSIVPCDELLPAKSVLSEVGAEVYDLVNEINKIAIQQASSDQHLVQICNPFSAPPDYLYQPENCEPNTTQIGNIPEALKLLTCSDANDGTCQGTEFVSNSMLTAVEAYASSIQNLLNSYPGMEGLVTCKSVKDAFSKILHEHCKPLKRCVRIIWTSMVFLSIIMVALVLLWIIKSHHEQKRYFSDGSVRPEATAAADMLETGL